MNITNLHSLFIHELQDIYDAERQLLKALPKMADAAHNDALKSSFAEHLIQTEGHIARLEQIAEDMDFELTGVTCKGMKGLIEEGEEVLTADGDAYAIDAALIGAAQKVEHYEIAAYGTALSHAEEMGHDDAAELLQQTLEEEIETDEKLTDVAESMVNSNANTMGDDDSDMD